MDLTLDINTSSKFLIELDEYLDLSDLEDVSKEFIEVVDKIPKKYIRDGAFEDDNICCMFPRNLVNPEDWKDYGLIDKHEKWEDSPVYDYLPKLRKFVSTLPYKNVSRIMIIFSRIGTEVKTHTDHNENWRQEVIWLNLCGDKKISVEGFDLKGKSCWLDNSCVHETKSGDGLSASLRIDGEFKVDFRKEIFNDIEWKTVSHYVDDTAFINNYSSKNEK